MLCVSRLSRLKAELYFQSEKLDFLYALILSIETEIAHLFSLVSSLNCSSAKIHLCVSMHGRMLGLAIDCRRANMHTLQISTTVPGALHVKEAD